MIPIFDIPLSTVKDVKDIRFRIGVKGGIGEILRDMMDSWSFVIHT